MSEKTNNITDPYENFFRAVFNGNGSDEPFQHPEDFKDSVDYILYGLTDTEMTIIKMRFGFDGYEPTTYDKIGKELNLSGERVGQIQRKLIRDIRHSNKGIIMRDGLKQYNYELYKEVNKLNPNCFIDDNVREYIEANPNTSFSKAVMKSQDISFIYLGFSDSTRSCCVNYLSGQTLYDLILQSERLIRREILTYQRNINEIIDRIDQFFKRYDDLDRHRFLYYYNMLKNKNEMDYKSNSFICEFIKKNPDNWRELLSEMKIIIKDDKNPSNYAIFNYRIGADFTNPIVQEARGIIIDVKELKVVCFPFRKFGKYNESYVDKIDWSIARVQEKIDGSIIKLWYDYKNSIWVFSTNGMIHAEDAYCDEENQISFLDLIYKTDTYSILSEYISNDKLIKSLTYIFELTTPKNQVVIKHYSYTMYHIGTRSNITGEELRTYIDPEIKKPLEFKLASLKECINALNSRNVDDNTGMISKCNFEGFVVVDNNWNRIKIKSPIYSILHGILNNGSVSKMKFIELVDKDEIDTSMIADEFLDKGHWLCYYEYKYREVLYQMNSFLNIVRKIYNENGNDRKDIANRIAGHKFAPIAFKGLGNEMSVKEILDIFAGGYINNLCKYIPNYEPENYGYLFKNKKEE